MSSKIQTHKPIPGVWELLVDSWNFYIKNFSTTIKTSILFLYVGIVVFLLFLLTRTNSNFALMNGIFSFVSGLFTLWIGIRLTVLILRLLNNKKALSAKEESQLSLQLIVPFIFINILVAFIVLGGTILFILPGIYFAVSLTMADLILVDKGLRGTQALAASRDLITGRWWPTFGRLFVSGFAYAVLFLATIGILSFLLASITGISTIETSRDSLIFGLDQFAQMAVMALLMPLVVGFHIKLYQALVKTR